MAVINPKPDLDTAARFARAKARQKALAKDVRAQAVALDQRRQFALDTRSWDGPTAPGGPQVGGEGA